MFNNLYLKAANARLTLDEVAANPMALVKKLERGDADSSGSTMRTAGVVALVLVIFLAIGAAVAALASSTAGNITTPAFK
jgi:hypothetical protein